MAIDQQENQAKEFLKREDIVTMKKDIKRLREADAFKESEKIVTTPIASQPPQNTKGVQETLTASLPKPSIVRKDPTAPIQKQPEKLITKVSGNKENATEDEKQKIFLFESQRTEAESQIQALDEKKIALDVVKSNLQKEREDWKHRLDATIKGGEVGSEEDQELEKTRWSIEKEFEKVQNRIKDIDAKYKELEVSKNQANQKINDINNSLKETYSTIEKRAGEKHRAELASPQEQPTISPKPRETTRLAQKQEPEKPYLKNVPTVVREKLTQSLNSEEEQRKKFLEDIDAWASYQNNQEEKK